MISSVSAFGVKIKLENVRKKWTNKQINRGKDALIFQCRFCYYIALYGFYTAFSQLMMLLCTIISIDKLDKFTHICINILYKHLPLTQVLKVLGN